MEFPETIWWSLFGNTRLRSNDFIFFYTNALKFERVCDKEDKEDDHRPTR